MNNTPGLPPVNPFDLIKQANDIMRQNGVEVYNPEQRGYDAMLAKSPAENNARYQKISEGTGLDFEDVRKMHLAKPDLHSEFWNITVFIDYLNKLKTILGEETFLKLCRLLPTALGNTAQFLQRYLAEVKEKKGDPFKYFSGNRKKYFGMKLEAIDAIEGYQETV